MNKKGISAVVTTVLIILLSIIAVIILWAALRPTVSDAADRAGTAISCTEISLEVKSCTIYADSINVSVARSGDSAGQINITAVVSDADSSQTKEISGVDPLATRVLDVSKTGLAGSQTVQVAARLPDGTLCSAVSKVCIAP